MKPEEIAEKHAVRALEAIASHVCNTDLTDGFCGPRDGKCMGSNGERPSHRNCVVRARGALKAMASRGVHPFWVFEKDLDANAVAAAIRGKE